MPVWVTHATPEQQVCRALSVQTQKEHFLVIWADLKEHRILLAPQNEFRGLSSSLGPGTYPPFL